MRKSLKLVSVAVLAAVVLSTSISGVFADSPYKTYTIDGYGSINETQTAYEPYQTITKIVYDETVEDPEGTGGLSLNAPQDMCIRNDKLYIADTGNKRIIVSTLDGKFIQEITYEEFDTPKGIFVNDEGRIYVADQTACAVFIFDKDGNYEKKITKPDHPLYGETMTFAPQKIVVNHGGVMFILCEKNRNGIVQMTEDDGGSFLGYFGTNYTNVSLITIIQRAILSDAARANMVSNMPATPDNLAIDEKNLIYTVTRGEEFDTLKKLNIAGTNMIEADAYEELPAAVATGQYNNIFVASQNGFIYEYNSEGELLFVFGGKDDGDQRIGLSNTLTSIQVDDNDHVYVLDTDAMRIQVYSPTEFTNKLHEALYLYSMGRYTESKKPLEEVLTMNSLFDYANKAMGKAYLMERDYETAMHYAELAKDADTYSTAFWEIRNEWLKENIVTAVFVILVIYILLKVYKKLKSKGKFDKFFKKFEKITSSKFVTGIRYSLRFIKHPIDGCYAVRREGKASYLVANTLLAVSALFYVVSKYFSGFLIKAQSGVREGRYDIVTDIGMLAIVFILFTACNYLVCTINDGEGRFKELYCAFAYSFTPYILIQVAIFALSHVVTYNELFIIQLAQFCMYVWILVLIVISIKEINNYTMKETIKVILLTIFCALIVVLIIYILGVLWGQVFDFFSSIKGEVVYRFGK